MAYWRFEFTVHPTQPNARQKIGEDLFYKVVQHHWKEPRYAKFESHDKQEVLAIRARIYTRFIELSQACYILRDKEAKLLAHDLAYLTLPEKGGTLKEFEAQARRLLQLDREGQRKLLLERLESLPDEFRGRYTETFELAWFYEFKLHGEVSLMDHLNADVFE